MRMTSMENFQLKEDVEQVGLDKTELHQIDFLVWKWIKLSMQFEPGMQTISNLINAWDSFCWLNPANIELSPFSGE